MGIYPYRCMVGLDLSSSPCRILTLKNEVNDMVYILILVAVFSRLVPHPPNFAPVMALSIFAGAYLGRYKGVAVALAAMLLSNAILGFYLLPVMLSVYGSMALGGYFGSFIGRSKTVMRIGGAVVGSSVLFFVLRENHKH